MILFKAVLSILTFAILPLACWLWNLDPWRFRLDRWKLGCAAGWVAFVEVLVFCL